MDSVVLLVLSIKKGACSSIPPEAFPSLKVLVLECVACVGTRKASSVEQRRGDSRQQIRLLSSLLAILGNLLKSGEDDVETMRDSVPSSVAPEDSVRADLVHSGLPILKWYQHVVEMVRLVPCPFCTVDIDILRRRGLWRSTSGWALLPALCPTL